jgi:hypothetical protein
MASSIISTTIDETYPVAGQDNDSQGFRDNFTIIKDNFAFAKSEIETLQDNTAKLNVDNNFNNNTQEKLNLKEYTIQHYNGDSNDDVDYKFTNGQFVKYIIGNTLTIDIQDWPTNEPYQYAEIFFALVSNGAAHEVTFTSKFGPTVNSNIYNDSSSEKYSLKQHNHVATSTAITTYEKLTYVKPSEINVDSTTVHTIVSTGPDDSTGTDFTLIGAADNNPGTTFIPTDTATGTGLLSAYLDDTAITTVTTTINNSTNANTNPWNGSTITLSMVTTNYKLIKAFTFNGGQDVYLEYLGTFTEV